ncbi:Asp-tRNA(Asn)/Glu-tRNA(Gln) amidotransferase subunit GatC [Gluconobacter wancherniae]|uniref:Aspartyl/glutamyl-tRNA(Asn/Gln) amidotransferase subunit C n=1 Tax=Gluconobacter wancherniae NBRC 103581 TaxID=656744 RepID=A0A511B1G6_9PROT|nr:Asp-tRNA(Asn)/Glu-tRNA(Gln) amidotransferase subunit GatC [Gluconobacter wancherniae]MBF0853486.1 Asp-tRNA(Asn)/Glu-tRNA(Gln) amidotransferase subunit GatC [Gluconobacter wancherniae]MBS1063276.1 Asp-tRNA(Asn)/Glu-tRNA(Gln) amidotransferase subunit GatC [Gluconobacter wancherniae]MBS1088306.1 Asp-tRNA(Asn)/Glu-tRNA(Gln) amidotransferase subunit GatC [Gluconobacter wancherniae]MBS1093991.1 Asp-tRNA(Asn)/Glu-tRNA(Gln) amidotransferase subunit GatC [Gluconobacter wancherniae]GBD55771.1 asparty
MSLDAKTVTRIARLARIGLAPEEVNALRQDMGSIIDWVEQLNEVDVTDVPPMIGTGLAKPRLREDCVTDGNRRDDVLSNAPDREGPFYTVPKVVE